MKKLLLAVVMGVVITGTALAGQHIKGAAQGDIPATSSWQAFEAMLKSSYMGTYAIYGALPENKKQEIYSQLKEGGSISKIRAQIVQARLSLK